MSGLAAAGVEKTQRDALGRWRPEGSDQYARTYKARVRSLIARFVGIVREGQARTEVVGESVDPPFPKYRQCAVWWASGTGRIAL